MRNLKKVLSLSLSLVMLLGLMMVGAGAATTYTDADDITYTEAVDVMSAIGVFSGSDTGDFQPNGDLTREQAAKIITYMLLGQTAADALTTNTAPFQDVAANRWSAGSIAYCVNMGIIAGDGNGHFYPTQTVNGYAFAKMLLVALGYDATIENYTGSGWQINVATGAVAAKLTAGLDVSLANTLTREQACQMAFNAIKADMVEYASKGTNITLPDGTVVNSGATPATSTGNTFRSLYFPNLAVSETGGNGIDALGRPARTWRNGATEIGQYAYAPTFTYTASMSSAANTRTVRNDLSGYIFTDNLAANNGSTGTIDGYDDVVALTGNGTVVEVYTDDSINTITKVVVIGTVLGEITRINTTANTVTVNFGSGNNVTVDEDNANYTALAAMEVGDQIVAILSDNDYAASTTLVSFVEPTLVTGTYTRQSGSNYTVGGTAYQASESYTVIGTDLDTLGNSYTLILDAYGYVLGVTEADNASTATYAYVTGDVVTEGNPVSGMTYYVQLLFTDGTVEWVEVTSYAGRSTSASLDGMDTAVDVGDFVTYTENSDGTYAISAPVGTGNATDATGSTATITRGTSSFVYNSTYYTLTNATVFLIQNADGTYATYTGIRNVPTTTLGTSAHAYILHNDATGADAAHAKAARIVVLTGSSAVSEAIFVYDTTSTGTSLAGDGTTVYTYKAIVNGEITTVELSNSSVSTAGLYNATAHDDYYTLGTGPLNNSNGNSFNGYTYTADPSSVSLSSGVLYVDSSADLVSDDFTVYAVDLTASPVTADIVRLSSTGDTTYAHTNDYVITQTNANGDVCAIFMVNVANS